MGDKPRKSGDVSDMAHRIKTLNRATIPREMLANPKVKVERKDG